MQILLLGGLLIINKTGIVQLNPYLIDGMIIWVSSMAIIMAVAQLRRPFTTAKVVDVKCPQCETPMQTNKLICGVCGSTFDLK